MRFGDGDIGMVRVSVMIMLIYVGRRWYSQRDKTVALVMAVRWPEMKHAYRCMVQLQSLVVLR
jgi:hypothetical protein